MKAISKRKKNTWKKKRGEEKEIKYEEEAGVAVRGEGQGEKGIRKWRNK